MHSRAERGDDVKSICVLLNTVCDTQNSMLSLGYISGNCVLTPVFRRFSD